MACHGIYDQAFVDRIPTLVAQWKPFHLPIRDDALRTVPAAVRKELHNDPDLIFGRYIWDPWPIEKVEPAPLGKPPQREGVVTRAAQSIEAATSPALLNTKKRQALLDSQAESKSRLTAQPDQEPRKSPRRAKLGDFYSVDEIAAAWGKSRNYVTKIFTSQPGVMVDPNGGKKKKRLEGATNDDASEGKRTYTTLIIPESVYLRVCRRLGYNSL